MEGAAADADPVGLPRLVGLEDMFSDEGWDLLSEERRRMIIDIWNTKQVEYTEESRRIHEKLVVGKCTTNFPPNPFLLADDFEGPIESIEQPWRIFTDPDAVTQLLKLLDEDDLEMEREEREALQAAKRDEGSGSDSDSEGSQ